MSANRTTAEYKLFLLDASNSMKKKLRGVPKIQIAKEGLKRFILFWPLYYPHWPMKVGVASFNLTGWIGETRIQELVPIMVSPTGADLRNLDDLKPSGGSPVYDALSYAMRLMDGIGSIDRVSPPAVKRIKLIGDGGGKRPDPLPICGQIAKTGTKLDTIELAERPSELMASMAEKGGGVHYLVRNVEEFVTALELSRLSERGQRLSSQQHSQQQEAERLPRAPYETLSVQPIPSEASRLESREEDPLRDRRDGEYH